MSGSGVLTAYDEVASLTVPLAIKYEVNMSDSVKSKSYSRAFQGLVNCVSMSSDNTNHWVACPPCCVLCSTHGTPHMSLSSNVLCERLHRKAMYHAQKDGSH